MQFFVRITLSSSLVCILKIFLNKKPLFFALRKTIRTMTDLWSCTARTRWRTRPPPSPSCVKTWGSQSSSPAHRWHKTTMCTSANEKARNEARVFVFLFLQRRVFVFRCPSTKWETTAETTCWGRCWLPGSLSSLRWGNKGGWRMLIAGVMSAWEREMFSVSPEGKGSKDRNSLVTLRAGLCWQAAAACYHFIHCRFFVSG